nr:helix-turn-helix transcriptional regulator [Clostridia bacterium]
MVVSERVKELIFAELKKRHMSKEQFAEMVGCHWQTVYKWAQGGRISLDLADRALRTLGMSMVIGENNQKGGEK